MGACTEGKVSKKSISHFIVLVGIIFLFLSGYTLQAQAQTIQKRFNDDKFIPTNPNSGYELYAPIEITGAPKNAVIEKIVVEWNVDHDHVSDVEIKFGTDSWNGGWFKLSKTGNDEYFWLVDLDGYSETSEGSKTYYPINQTVNQKWYLIAKDIVDDANKGRLDWWRITIYYTTVEKKPDLTITSVSTDQSSVQAGQKITISFTAKNTGNESVGDYAVKAWLTKGKNYSPNDSDNVMLCSASGYSGLRAGQSRREDITCTVPEGTTSGRYYACVWIDYSDRYKNESDENNNIGVSNDTVRITKPVEKKPDLTITSVSIEQSSVQAGQKVTISFTAKNAGNESVGDYAVKAWLTKGKNYSPNDSDNVMLCSASGYSGLRAGQSRREDITCTVPESTTSGRYYACVWIDYSDRYKNESNENNNIGLSNDTVQIKKPVEKKYDLKPTSLSIRENTVEPGGKIHVDCRIENLGNEDSPTFSVKFYLSTDGDYDVSDDSYLKTVDWGAIPRRNNSSRKNIELELPSGMKADTKYWILVLVNPNHKNDEQNNNNQIILSDDTINIHSSVLVLSGCVMVEAPFDKSEISVWSENMAGAIVSLGYESVTRGLIALAGKIGVEVLAKVLSSAAGYALGILMEADFVGIPETFIVQLFKDGIPLQEATAPVRPGISLFYDSGDETKVPPPSLYVKVKSTSAWKVYKQISLYSKDEEAKVSSWIKSNGGTSHCFIFPTNQLTLTVPGEYQFAYGSHSGISTYKPATLVVTNKVTGAVDLVVPYYEQGRYTHGWCWAAATSMLLKYYGYERKPWQVAADFDASPTTAKSAEDTKKYLDKHYNNGDTNTWILKEGLKADSELIQKIALPISKGHPVIVSRHRSLLPWSSIGGHQVVVTGYSGTNLNDNVYYNDPSGALVNSCKLIVRDLTWEEFIAKLNSMWGSDDLDLLYANPESALSPHKSPVSIQILSAAPPSDDKNRIEARSGLWFTHIRQETDSSDDLKLILDGSKTYPLGYYYDAGHAASSLFHTAPEGSLFPSLNKWPSEDDTLNVVPYISNTNVDGVGHQKSIRIRFIAAIHSINGKIIKVLKDANKTLDSGEVGPIHSLQVKQTLKDLHLIPNKCYYLVLRVLGPLGESPSALLDEVKFAFGLAKSAQEDILPKRPTAISPKGSLKTVNPVFEWSTFQDGGDNETQAGYQLQVLENAIVIYDTGLVKDTTNHTHTYEPEKYHGQKLEWGHTYSWQVRYQDSGGDWSSWSEEASFTPFREPHAPELYYPTAGKPGSTISSGGDSKYPHDFCFYVVYYDDDGDKPASGEVVITGDNGSKTSYDMSLMMQTPWPGREGYSGIYKTGFKRFDVGQYEYHFEFSDGDLSARLPETGELSFEVKKPVDEPPYPPPSNPSPASGATKVDLTPVLSWTESTDPEGKTVTYNVYFGTNSDVTSNLVSSALKSPEFKPDQFLGKPLSPETTYYWQVVASDGTNKVTGPVWKFTTKGNESHCPNLSKFLIKPETDEMISGVDYFFYVKYLDKDGDPPAIAEVRIQPKNAYSPATILPGGMTSYKMTLLNGVAYDGVYRSEPISLDPGEYCAYLYFKEKSSSGREVVLPENKCLNITVRESQHCPVLSDGKVSPESGDTSTQFTFSVKYSDADSDAPQVKSVVIDGTNYTMALRSGSAANGTYEYGPKTFSAGTHSYYFEFDDGKCGMVQRTDTKNFTVTGPSVNKAKLVAYYPLDGNANDTIGGRNGTIVGNPTVVPGVKGQAYEFDNAPGNNSYIKTSGSYEPGTKPFAVALWFKKDGGSAEHPWSRLLSTHSTVNWYAPNYAIFIHYSDGALMFMTNDAGDNHRQYIQSQRKGLNDNNWHLVVVQRESNGDLEIWIDGKLDTKKNFPVQNIRNGKNPLGIGAGAYNYWSRDRSYKGAIDEVRIYEGALTAQEIQDLFSSVTIPAQHCPVLTDDDAIVSTVLGGSGNTLFEDDFSGNLTDNWDLYGSPRPIKQPSMGNPAPCFDNNGDASYDSGATSKRTFDYSNGLVIESDMYSRSDPAGCWVSASIGILKDYNFNDNRSAKYAVEFFDGYSGAMCNSKAQGVVGCLIITETGDLERHTLTHYNDLQGKWHHFKIVIEPSRHVKFYIDGELFYETVGRLSLDYNNMPLLLGNRSSNYGDALIDNLKVNSYGSGGQQSVQFRVHYRDEDGDTPTTKLVYIDGVSYEMILSSGKQYDGLYVYETTALPAGTHKYYFEFSDGHCGQVVKTSERQIDIVTETTAQIKAWKPDTGVAVFPNPVGYGSTIHFIIDPIATQSITDDIVEIRVCIYTFAGSTVYDTNWVEGANADWIPPSDIARGPYISVIYTRTNSGIVNTARKVIFIK